jgi:site-specific DNA-cytosine methylase
LYSSFTSCWRSTTEKEIRDLAWVIPKFAGKVKPDIISMENVKQMLNWGPLIAKRDKATGRVVTLDKIIVNGKNNIELQNLVNMCHEIINF